MIDVRTLPAALETASEEQLDRITHLWGMQGKVYENRAAVLLERAEDLISARFVYETLAPAERMLLSRILTPAAARTGISRSELLKKTRLPTDELDAACEQLARTLLIFTTSDVAGNVTMHPFAKNREALYAVDREFFKSERDRSRLQLRDVLAKLDVEQLYAIANGYDMSWPSFFSSRVDTNYTISNTLYTMKEPLSFLRTISDDAFKLYVWLREQSGRVRVRDARTLLGFSDASLWEALHFLERRALAFDTFSQEERVLFIPEDIYKNLGPVSNTSKPETKEYALETLDAEPPAVYYAGPLALYDLAILINASFQQNIEPTQAGRIPKRIYNKLRPLLKGEAREDYDSEDDYLEMLFYALDALEVLQLSHPPLPDIKPRYEPGSQFDAWSRMDMIEQARRLLRHWLSNVHYIDNLGADIYAHYNYIPNPLEARAALLKQLRTCTPDRWYTIESLLYKLWNDDYFALRPENPYNYNYNYNSLFLQPERPQTKEVYEKWRKSDGEIYIGMIDSTLQELGLVSTGRKQIDKSAADDLANPYAFMVTELGAAVLAVNTPPVSTDTAVVPSRTLVVQPNFELLLLQPDLPTLYSVLPFVQAVQIGVVSRLTLTRTSLLRGLERLRSVEGVIQILQGRSQKELPQNVVYTLNDWSRFYREVRVSQVLLLEVSGENIADQLCTSSTLQKFGIRQIAPGLLAVNADLKLQDLKKLLDKEEIVLHLSSTSRPGGKRTSSFEIY